MQKFLFVVLTLLILGSHTFAQKASVEGLVKSSTGEVLSGATVQVKGTTIGALTDDKGHFTLKAAPNDVLVGSFIGFVSSEVVVGNQKTVTLSLPELKEQISEVVVTALGIEKQKSTIGFAVEDIKGSELVKAREPNPINALTGKIAGLTVGSSTEMLGAPTVLLRGYAPLYVVDGVPVQTDTWDINPDDIETYTVLKGPAAAALYGSRGQFGAIQITSKRGSKDKRGFNAEFNSSTMYDGGFIALPQSQDLYGPGDHGVYAFGDGKGGNGGLNDADYDIWGPAFNGQNIPQYDSPVVNGVRTATPWTARGKNNLKRFLQTGSLSTNSFSFGATNGKGDIRMSASHSYQKGMVPNTQLNMTNFNLSGGYNITPKLRVDANLAYGRQYTPNTPDVTMVQIVLSTTSPFGVAQTGILTICATTGSLGKRVFSLITRNILVTITHTSCLTNGLEVIIKMT